MEHWADVRVKEVGIVSLGKSGSEKLIGVILAWNGPFILISGGSMIGRVCIICARKILGEKSRAG